MRRHGLTEIVERGAGDLVERLRVTPEERILVVQGNLAKTYGELGYMEKALSMERDVYSGRLKLHGEEHPQTLLAANNYVSSLVDLQRFEEARSLMRRTMPVVRRVLGESNDSTLKTRWIYAQTLYRDAGAALDDVFEAVTTLEEAERISRRVFGGAHPLTEGIEGELRDARAALRARDTPPTRG